MSPDHINGLYEAIGGAVLWLNVLKLYKDKKVHGVHWLSVLFFASWGYWNLYYYPSLEQWWSFFGGAFLVTANTVWLLQLIYYTRRTLR